MSARRHLAVGGAATLLGLAVCEAAARAAFPAPPDPTRQPQIVYRVDPEVRYVLAPNQKGWVDDGFVTLTGTADWQFQRDEAESAASSIAGLRDVFDDIALKPRPSSIGIEESIAAAFKRNAGLDAGQLSVTTSDGTVTIRGDVRSWAEHDQALAAAWAAPGVSNVDDRINITY